MKLEEHNATIQRRILDANNHWRTFMSEMPLRDENFAFAPKSLQTKVETSPEITDTSENTK